MNEMMQKEQKLEYKCAYCNKTLDPENWAVFETTTGRTFCISEHAPLEPNSCALKFQEENRGLINKEKTYIFIKLSDYI